MTDTRFPDLNVQLIDYDPRLRTRTIPMKVLVLGYPRTGTSSIQKALEDLGFGPCYHMRTCINERPRDCGLRTEFLRTKYDKKGTITAEEFDHVLGDCASACDLPATAFAPDLITAYPSAKIILTNRPVEAWHKSTASTLQVARHYWLHSLLSHIDWVTSLVHTMRVETWRCLFADDFEANGRSAMQSHYELVRTTAAAQGREVLEFGLSDGWEPLCRFLEVEVPDTPYPRMNEGGDWTVKMQTRAWMRLREVVGSASGSVVPVMVGVAAVAWLARRRVMLGRWR